MSGMIERMIEWVYFKKGRSPLGKHSMVYLLQDHTRGVTLGGHNSSVNKGIKFILNKNEKSTFFLGRQFNRTDFLAVPEVSSLLFCVLNFRSGGDKKTW